MTAQTPLIIYGSGGLGREVAQAVQAATTLKLIGFCDDAVSAREVLGVPVLGGLSALAAQPDPLALYLAVGDSTARRNLLQRLQGLGRTIALPNVIHPAATLDPARVRLGLGNYVAAGARVAAGVRLGDFNIINFNAVLGHDVGLGDHCHVGPGAILNGEDQIGDRVLVGAGAVLMPRLKVGAGAVVGIGSVLATDVAAGHTVAGNPARVIRRPDAPA